ncbi:hypothetical protein SAMN06269250_0965 [Spirosoma fluviale]|uniref:Uncharacterized protein n=2 Tax=Spirosoma fluviale TaxID=1597977 RepID=A0A286F8M2_9BACT|nr:hypothetical protein SAMN06269250_0965 [Spirosoma fluviale]
MLVACSSTENEIMNPVKDNNVSLYTVKHSAFVTNQSTKKEFATFFNKVVSINSNSRISAGSETLDLSNITFNFENLEEIYFENTSAKSVSASTVTKDGTKYIFSSLYDGSTAMNDGLITKIFSDGNRTELSYYDLTRTLVAKIVVNKNGELVSAKSFNIPNPNARVSGYIGNWAKCVGTVANQMTDGSITGSIATIGCMAWGGACAIAVGVGCAISASVNHF